MLWTGVISHRTGKRDGVLENFRLVYEMLLIRHLCLVELCGQIWYSSCDLAQ